MVLDFDIVEACVEVIYEKCIPVLSIAEYTTTEIEYKDNIEVSNNFEFIYHTYLVSFFRSCRNQLLIKL